jgi:hypothetical protein
MKSATFPSVRVEPSLREAAQDVLREGETLSGFVERSIRESIDRRLATREFIARGLLSRERARQSGNYVAASDVVRDLEARLARAKAASKRGK